MNQTSTDRIEKQVAIKAPLSRVWRALTDYREFSQWFMVDLDSPFVAGQTSRGQTTHPECTGMMLELQVRDLEPEHYFSYYWEPYAPDPERPDAEKPRTLVEFRLEETGTGTLLRVIESGFDRLPDARREQAYRMNDGGWTEQMKNIEAHVRKHP